MSPSTSTPVTVLRRLHADDTGAQSMEYAALAAGGCTAVGLLIALLESEPVQDAIRGILERTLDTIGSGMIGLLPF